MPAFMTDKASGNYDLLPRVHLYGLHVNYKLVDRMVIGQFRAELDNWRKGIVASTESKKRTSV